MGFKGTYRKRKVELSRVTPGEAQSAQVGTFEEDIRVLTSLKHPNVLACHGCYTDRDRGVPPCRVVELAERGTLQDLLARGFLPHRHGGLFLWLALDLARALQYLHGLNKLHRDVKAESVLVTRDWHAKLTGFSFLRVQGEGAVQTQVGTPYWTAPEIFAQKPYDCKVDVYSYAMTLVEMLLGEVPWSRELAAAPELTMVKLAFKVANDSCRPAIPEGVPPLVRTLIISCRARFHNAIARGFRATPCVSKNHVLRVFDSKTRVLQQAGPCIFKRFPSVYKNI